MLPMRESVMRFIPTLGIAFIIACGLPATAQRRGFGAPVQENLAFRFVGPAVGNRIASVAGVPSENTAYSVGGAAGGVWKTTDSGKRWAPSFGGQSAQAMGAIAVAPSGRKTVWAGTGEAWVIRERDMMGSGIYKSTDSG